jgi:hypothetical protein
MRAATRRFIALLKITDEIVANEVKEEAEICYFCPAKLRHSHHSVAVG